MFRVNIGGAIYKVTFSHQQNRDILGIIPGQGGTNCAITCEQTGIMVGGRSHLHPKDTLNRKIGRKIALARALQEYGFSKESREIFWDEFKKVCRYE